MVPYQLSSPARGVITIPIDRSITQSWSQMVLFHELFHAVQGMSCSYSKSCIGQIHEWTPAFRKGIPQWTGRGELDYYTWRFDETLARIGWKKLNYRQNSPSAIDQRTLQRNLDVESEVSLEKRRAAWEVALRAGRTKGEGSVALYEQALRLNPYHPGALLALAAHYSKREEHRRAIGHYDALVDVSPPDPNLFYWRALLYGKLNERDAAIRDFNRVLELDPNMNWAYYHRALQYAAQKKHVEAEADFTRAVELEPTFAWAWYHRAMTRNALRRRADAEADFTRAALKNMSPPR